MASPLIDISYGFGISFPVSGFLAEIVSVHPPGQTVEDIDSSHQGMTNAIRTFSPSDLKTQGELTIGVHFNPDGAAVRKSPLGVVETEILITFPSTATWKFAGYCNNFEPADMALDEKMMAELTFKVSGIITIVDAS